MRARRALILIAAVHALLLAVVAFLLLRGTSADDGPQDGWHGTAIVPAMAKQPFVLQSVGGPVRSSDLRDQLTVLFFGYTHCPDFCPLTLERIAQARRMLRPRDAEAVQVVLVSLDPERDSVERLEQYVSRFDTSFTGVTGTRAEIEAVARDYGIYHAAETATSSAEAAHGAHATPAAEAPMIAHTTHVLVLDRAGRLALLWSPEITADQMAEDLRRLLRT